MVGDEDDSCLEPGIFLKRTIPTAGLFIQPRTGHAINLEEPAVFNREVQEFFSTVERGRWGKRDPMGIQLLTFVERMDATSPTTFRIFLREACGFVLEALGKPSSNVPFIMPKRVAETDAFKQIEDYTGSGPYVFKKDEFKPGDKAVYLRNAKYVARKEPPSGLRDEGAGRPTKRERRQLDQLRRR